MKIEVDVDDANAITVDCLKQYYLENHHDESANVSAADWDLLMSLDLVLSHFMTEHEYEDFNNGLRQKTLTL
tara:strand:+ start:142 stop:357 length:216 start_codon:yes stop_codon:yes gene_type:complete